MIPCLKVSNVTLHQLDVKEILKKYSMIVLMQGIAIVLFGTSRKRYVKIIGENHRRWFFDTVRNYGPLGIIAYSNGEPAGWCGIAPRGKYDRLRRSRFFSIVDDCPVWSVTCFVVRKKFRRQGLSRLLLREAIVFAQSQGAECIEGYPFDLDRGTSRGDLYPGILSVFLAEGFVEVARRLPTRPVVRLGL